MKPQEPIPHNYSIAKLNKIFAISSIALLMGTGAMVVYDYVRGWKRFQLTFLQLQEQKIRADLRAARDSQDRAELARLDSEFREQEIAIAARREEFRRAEQDLETWEGRHYAADQNYRFAKATLDAMRYDAELAAQQRRRGWENQQRAYQEQAARVEELNLILQQVTRDRDAARQRMERWRKAIADIEGQRAEMNATIERLRTQLATVEANPAFMLLNAPLLDFISPTLKIDQIILNDLFIDLNYMHAPRVDRCTTCHRAIDRPGFESRQEAARLQAELEQQLENFLVPADRIEETRLRVEQLAEVAGASRNLKNPYRTHPYLDMFVGSSSPHPLLDFGCTSCHRGLDRSTDFARAGHSPSNSEQMHRWEEEHNWKPQPFLETPMHPRQYLQGSCLKCHSNQVTIPGAPEMTRATAMVEFYGCYSCHKIDSWRFTDLRKPGPDLTGIAEKTTPEWAARWIAAPHAFRPTTRMPASFYQRNIVGPTVNPSERARNIRNQNVEIHAIVSYLFNASSRRQWQAGPQGDAGRGMQLVNNVGCMGCHIVQDAIKDEEGNIRVARRDDFPLERLIGFNLVGMGTKTNPEWLFNWLKDPRHYYAEAPMPDLRLTDQEAADITALLMTFVKPNFMKQPLPPPDLESLSSLTKSYLINTMSDRDANARLASMPVNDQLVYLGQRTIEKYGCYSCHTIEGFDDMKPIGTELTTQGSKHIHLFDFGFVHDHVAWDGKEEHVRHTVPSWIYNKLRSPRVFDDRRERSYHEKLKMPNYYLSPAEAEAITSVITGMTKDRVATQYLASMTPEKRAAEEGRKLISQHNCRACHVVEGYGRAIGFMIEDAAYLPPDLTPQGARVQSPWLFNFLKDPTVMSMRPWMDVRMPTFHFSDREASTLVSGFAAEGNVPQFDTARFSDPVPRNVAVGQAVYEMLRCAQCHPASGALTVTDASSLAPPLDLSRARLQHDWIPDWIRRPNEIIPGTRMPTNFPRDAQTGEFTSPLGMAINTPAFASYKSRLMQYYASEEELVASLEDVEELTNYLRDYIWTIGPAEMRMARPTTPAEVPRDRPPAQRPAVPDVPSLQTGAPAAASEAPGR
ncbi:MAG TPA: c-type cytochrome [Thermoanaerobaculia bacterium]|nr:c-type cytochrome [Thermoanaerobaculia bacterium]